MRSWTLPLALRWAVGAALFTLTLALAVLVSAGRVSGSRSQPEVVSGRQPSRRSAPRRGS